MVCRVARDFSGERERARLFFSLAEFARVGGTVGFFRMGADVVFVRISVDAARRDAVGAPGDACVLPVGGNCRREFSDYLF